MLHAYVKFCTLSTSLRLRIANRAGISLIVIGMDNRGKVLTVWTIEEKFSLLPHMAKDPTISDKLVGAAWWRRPRMKVYDFNFWGNYYQVTTKCFVFNVKNKTNLFCSSHIILYICIYLPFYQQRLNMGSCAD